jgi:4-carboxymuconolactone decarboxylase
MDAQRICHVRLRFMVVSPHSSCGIARRGGDSARPGAPKGDIQDAAKGEWDMNRLVKFGLVAMALSLPQFSMAQDSVRFPPISPDRYTAEQKEFEKLLTSPPRNGTLATGPFKVYFRSPVFGLEAIRMSDYLRWGTGMEPRLVELAIIISARNSGSDYIWHAHYPAAVKGGLDPSVGADIAAGKRPTKMKADEEIIYNLLSDIYRDQKVSDASYKAALAKYGEKGITDIIGLAGYYGITAMALMASDAVTAPGDEPKLQKLAQAFPK